MTARDDLIATLHQQRIDDGIATQVNGAVRGRLLKGVLSRLIGGQSKYQIVEWLNTQASAMDKDVRCEATAVYDMIKDVNINE